MELQMEAQGIAATHDDLNGEMVPPFYVKQGKKNLKLKTTWQIHLPPSLAWNIFNSIQFNSIYLYSSPRGNQRSAAEHTSKYKKGIEIYKMYNKGIDKSMLSKQMYNKSDCGKVLTVLRRAKWSGGRHRDAVLELTTCIEQ